MDHSNLQVKRAEWAISIDCRSKSRGAGNGLLENGRSQEAEGKEEGNERRE